MRSGSGVDGAIHAAGGPEILAHCGARFPNGLATGDAGWTTVNGEEPDNARQCVLADSTPSTSDGDSGQGLSTWPHRSPLVGGVTVARVRGIGIGHKHATRRLGDLRDAWKHVDHRHDRADRACVSEPQKSYVMGGSTAHRGACR